MSLISPHLSPAMGTECLVDHMDYIKDLKMQLVLAATP